MFHRMRAETSRVWGILDKPPFIQNWKEPSCIGVSRYGEHVSFWSGRHCIGQARVVFGSRSNNYPQAAHFGLLDNCRLLTHPKLRGYYSILGVRL